ncbi:MAG: methylated-DNA--[protein]-cysteine S-methyltransferase [Planctomycetota bacterium]
MKIYAHVFDSPIAPVLVAVDEAGAVKHLDFVGRRTKEELLARMRKGGRTVVWEAAPCAEVQKQVEEYFRGERTAFELDLAGDGTEFQRSVWSALLEIPFGETTSYGELARRLGKPNASRAVGRANGTNPISLCVPCHRVIGADGSLTGYGGGLPTKRALLDFERGQLTFAEQKAHPRETEQIGRP